MTTGFKGHKMMNANKMTPLEVILANEIVGLVENKRNIISIWGQDRLSVDVTDHVAVNVNISGIRFTVKKNYYLEENDKDIGFPDSLASLQVGRHVDLKVGYHVTEEPEPKKMSHIGESKETLSEAIVNYLSKVEDHHAENLRKVCDVMESVSVEEEE